MLFGLKNVPSTFYRMMDAVLNIFDFAWAYLDGVPVYSKTMNVYRPYLQNVFVAITGHCLRWKISKCVFAKCKVELLGHIISADGVTVDPRQNYSYTRCSGSILSDLVKQFSRSQWLLPKIYQNPCRDIRSAVPRHFKNCNILLKLENAREISGGKTRAY